jgi:STE24 endopeptidase
MRYYWTISVLILSYTLFARVASGQEPKPPFDQQQAQIAAGIEDPEKATRAYLDSVPEERRQKTKAYARGNYVLNAVDFIWSSLVLIGLLALGVSAKIRDVTRRVTKRKPIQTLLYWVQFLLITTLFAFPFTVYRSFFRERAYGLLNQSFGDWMIDQAKGLAIGIVLGGIFVMLLYGVLRKAPRLWWLWGSVVVILFIVIGIAIAPVYIQPMFNKFTPVQNQEIRESILDMAHEQGIPAEEVYEMDASRRTDRISAYVAGLFGTMRIVMFDTTLKRCTPEEIQFIMGHEMGHYVLNHIGMHIAFFAIIIVGAFLFAKWGFAKAIQRWPGWRVEGIGDNAGLPLLLLLLTAFLFFTAPITNTWIRVHEDEADDFGLEASRNPDAAATTFLKLGEYRDLEPHPIVEALFYDHPSGRYRIRNAMEWEAEFNAKTQ